MSLLKYKKLSDLPDLSELWEIDSQLNPTMLEQHQMMTSNLHAKYHGLWSKAQKFLIDRLFEKEVIEGLLNDYYSRIITKSEELELINKKEPWQIKLSHTEKKSFIAIDPNVIDIQKSIRLHELYITQAEEIIRNLNFRTNQIKNIIELRKLDKGLV